jgi:1-acyl-sn-glycerol-3-phosphate acyltransferase
LSDPSTQEIAALERQALIGWLAFPWVSSGAIFYMRFVRKNRVKDLAGVRRKFREIVQTGRPIVICANHLTMLDSFYLHWALCSQLDYMRRFRLFAWNVPAVENFKRSAPISALTYLTKTVAIDRAGTPEHHRAVLGKLGHLVREGQLVTIFPEAGRSRTGRIEPAEVAYGVGQMLRDVPDALVVCVYLRGDRQETWGDKPARGDAIEVDIETLEPKTSAKGMRASRDISRQIILKLKEMEDRYFARRA